MLVLVLLTLTNTLSDPFAGSPQLRNLRVYATGWNSSVGSGRLAADPSVCGGECAARRMLWALQMCLKLRPFTVLSLIPLHTAVWLAAA